MHCINSIIHLLDLEHSELPVNPLQLFDSLQTLNHWWYLIHPNWDPELTIVTITDSLSAMSFLSILLKPSDLLQTLSHWWCYVLASYTELHILPYINITPLCAWIHIYVYMCIKNNPFSKMCVFIYVYVTHPSGLYAWSWLATLLHERGCTS